MNKLNPNLKNWLALYHTSGVGPAKFEQHLQQNPNLDSLPPGIKPDWVGVDRDLNWLEQNSDALIITLQDDSYPMRLKQIANPPPILYVRGDYKLLSMPQIAIVGSRLPSVAGINHAQKFAAELIDLGLVITSGMAQGIDGASHIAALKAGGKTIAVLGNGIDIVYPQRHARLAQDIIANGCLLSEFSVATPVQAYNFPRRNRIISGLAYGVLVVEAALNSGSLITAAYAMEQGREVFAIPGAISNTKAKGCHKLIRQGAKLVDDLSDIVEELAPLLRCAIRDKTAAKLSAVAARRPLADYQERLLSKIDYDSTCVDVIVARSGLTTSVVAAQLLELELQGLISSVPGGYARRLG